MPQRMTYECSCCGECIENDEACPIVAYVVVGRVGTDGEVTYVDGEIPAYADAVLQLPVHRREYCMCCFAKHFHVDSHEVESVVDEAVQKHGLHPREAKRILAVAAAEEKARRDASTHPRPASAPGDS